MNKMKRLVSNENLYLGTYRLYWVTNKLNVENNVVTHHNTHQVMRRVANMYKS